MVLRVNQRPRLAGEWSAHAVLPGRVNVFRVAVVGTVKVLLLGSIDHPFLNASTPVSLTAHTGCTDLADRGAGTDP